MPDKIGAKDECETLWKVLRLQPELEALARIALRARASLNYPLKTLEDLAPVLEGPEPVMYRGAPLSMALAAKYATKEFFPVEDEDALVTRALVALMRGHLSHFPEHGRPDTGRFVAGPLPVTHA